METHARSIAKAVSWRIVATTTTILLVFIFTGNLVVSGGVGLTELLSKTVIYYFHERAWNTADFGRTPKSKMNDKRSQTAQSIGVQRRIARRRRARATIC